MPVVASSDDPRFAELVRIYQSSIERSEQKDEATLKAMLADRRYTFLVSEERERVTGFAIVFVPSGRTFWLLEYMGVDERHRSAGLGAALFSEVVAAAAVASNGAPGLLEVDRPEGEAQFVAIAERRLRFYGRCGCRALEGLAYILPLEAHGAPPPMTILVHGRAELFAVERDVIAGWLRDIYSEVYGQSRDDVRIQNMVSQLPNSVRLVTV